jgi:hypothetical protein
LVFDERAVVEATIELFLSVRKVVPGALADTGRPTTANIKTLRANASDPPIAARRARKVSGDVIRRHAASKKPVPIWPVCPCIFFMLQCSSANITGPSTWAQQRPN